MDYNGQREVTRQTNKPPCCRPEPDGKKKTDVSAMERLQESAPVIII